MFFVFKTITHLEIRAKLDYPASLYPHFQDKVIKYDFKKSSKIPYLETTGIPTKILLARK